MHLDPTQILVRPLITEKGNLLREDKSQYLFEVHPDATKKSITDAVEKLFEVNVQDVRVLRTHAKAKRVGRYAGHRASMKKAYVQLAEGQKIDFFQEV